MPAKTIAVTALLICLICLGPALAAPDMQALEQEGNQISALFFKELVGALHKAIKAGGVASAIGVCHERAPKIAARISAETGWQVGRVGTRLRNPANAPDAWEAAVLGRFEERLVEGQKLRGMSYAEVVDENGKPVFRMMKAIPTGGMCLNCHGSNLKPEVAANLARLYPGDKATGYAKGDLRGAFTLSKPLD